VRGVTAILIVSLAFPVTDLGAQHNSPLETGDLLRITAPDCGVNELLARYLRLYRDTLTVQADSEIVLPLVSVTRLDVSRGLSNRTTLIGVLYGAIAGVVVGIIIAPDEHSAFTDGNPSQTTTPQLVNPVGTGGGGSLSGAAVGPIAGAFIGGFVGGLVGKAFRKHRWEVLPLDDLRLGIGPPGYLTVLVGRSVRVGRN